MLLRRTLLDEDTGRAVSTDSESILIKFRENLAEQQKINMNVMNKIAQMKYEKARRNRSENDYWMDKDPIFGEERPEFHKSEEYKNSMDLHPELKKMIYSTLYEKPDHAVANEEEAQIYEDM